MREAKVLVSQGKEGKGEEERRREKEEGEKVEIEGKGRRELTLMISSLLLRILKRTGGRVVVVVPVGKCVGCCCEKPSLLRKS